jgi:putative SOS response-associated peptidase YedK
MMCGRYGLELTPDIQERFRIVDEIKGLSPNYNIAPTTFNPVVVSHSPNSVEMMKWGLIAPWSPEPKTIFSTINARSEHIAESKLYRKPLQQTRCIVPANIYYEWKATPEGKRPYLFKLRDNPYMGLAGLYSVWKNRETGEEVKSYTIITVAANELVREVHHRMPAILDPEYEDLWVDSRNHDVTELMEYIKPFPTDQMECYPVSSEINRASFRVEACPLPLNSS